MARKTRTHLPTAPDAQTDPALMPKHLTKQEFARRLGNLMAERKLWQSELARLTGLPRDSISTYINGKSLPRPDSLTKLAEALGVDEEFLLPNHTEAAILDANPEVSLRTAPGQPGVAWLSVNRLVSLPTAVKIVDMLSRDEAIIDRG